MNKGFGTLFQIACLALSAPYLQAQTLYTLKDLEVLEREKNFNEFLSHVNDIRPSERQKLWRDMYQSMAMELVDTKIREKDFSLKSFRQIEATGRASALANDEFFQLRRAQYAQKFFSECYLQSSLSAPSNSDYTIKNCDKELNSFWTFSRRDPDVGLALAELLDKYPSTLSAWPFYQRAINDSVAPIYCDKPLVQKAIIKKLTQETFDPAFNGDYKTLTNGLVPEKCFAKLIPTLKEMTSSALTNGLEKEMALNILEAKGKINPADEDMLAVVYLLDGPVVGDKMNVAWNKVEKMSENFNKRKDVMEKIKGLDLIPDKIFKDPESPRNKAIINLFARNFPEILNYYGDRCVDLLDTKVEMPANIASGHQCSQFLRSAQAVKKEGQQWISDTVATRYSALSRPASKPATNLKK